MFLILNFMCKEINVLMILIFLAKYTKTQLRFVNKKNVT